MKRHGDPLTAPLDRHLWAQRLAYSPEAYRPLVEHFDRWAITCPRCSSQGRTAVVIEHGEEGLLTFTCASGCPPERIADSARSLEEFFVDGHDSPVLPLAHNPVEGWLVKLPLREFADLLEDAA